MGILLMLFSYGLGAIPFGLIVGKLWANVDVREHGSKNIGFSNVLRTVGPLPASFVLLLDAGKGIVPVVLAKGIFPELPTWQLLMGLCAIAGHNWSVFLGFRGGKGVATTAGVLIALAPSVAFIAIGIWLLLLFLFRYISLASIVAGLSLPFLFMIMGYPFLFVVLAIILTGLVLYRHIPNIHRLRAGKEYKFGQKGRK